MPGTDTATSREQVTASWHRIHAELPGIHHIAMPERIDRLRKRDFNKIIESDVCLPSPARILEAGCGSGRDSLFFSTLGHSCVAIDIDETPLAKLRNAQLLYEERNPGVSLQLTAEHADIFHLPFADNSFHFVFNSGVIEHYDTATRLALLREMHRVTTAGGCACIIFPNKKHLLYGWWEMLANRFASKSAYDIPESDLTDVVQDLDSVGLELIREDWLDCYETICHYPSVMPLRAIAHIMATLMPRPPASMRKLMGVRTIILARKQ
ncbi:MAG: class I SAM-dependent methyltransferase [Bacteroidota bacterium]